MIFAFERIFVNENFMKGLENVRDLSREDDFREREFQRVQ